MDNIKYLNIKKIKYYSKRYKKYITVPKNEPSDGATGAFDIKGDIEVFSIEKAIIILVSLSWIVHDRLCKVGLFDDGTTCTNFMASCIISDILWSEKRWFRSVYWWPATFFFGGKGLRKF